MRCPKCHCHCQEAQIYEDVLYHAQALFQWMGLVQHCYEDIPSLLVEVHWINIQIIRIKL